LFNVELISAQFQMSEADITAKRADLHHEYARSLFWMREMRLARKCYAQALRDRPSLSGALHWAATFLPRFVLDIRRPKSSAAARPTMTHSNTPSLHLAASR
jgi:hypothetical protein